MRIYLAFKSQLKTWALGLRFLKQFLWSLSHLMSVLSLWLLLIFRQSDRKERYVLTFLSGPKSTGVICKPSNAPFPSCLSEESHGATGKLPFSKVNTKTLRRALKVLTSVPGAIWSTWVALFDSFGFLRSRLFCSHYTEQPDLGRATCPSRARTAAVHLPILQAEHSHLTFLPDNIGLVKVPANLDLTFPLTNLSTYMRLD